jgi:hypothetical protein
MKKMRNVFVFLSIFAIIFLHPASQIQTAEAGFLSDNHQNVPADREPFLDGQPVLLTRNGKFIKETDRFLIPNGETPEGKVSINYEESTGFEPEELQYIKEFIEGEGQYKVGILECIEMVFGKPFFGIEVKLVKKDAPTSFYDATREVITLQPRICKAGDLYPKLETLAHELVHAFSDVMMKPMNCYEEGMAIAQTDLACRLFCQFNNINGKIAEIFDGPPGGTRNYDLLNQEATAAADGFFWNSSTTKRVVDPSTRYMLAGVAWWKIWRETVPGNISVDDPRTYGSGTFFVDFNTKFFSVFKSWITEGKTIVFDKDLQRLFLLKLRETLREDKENDYVEGLEFEDWWSGQYILQTYIDEGPKLYVTQTWQPTLTPEKSPQIRWESCGFLQIAYFYRDSKGNEYPLNGKLTVNVTSLSKSDYGSNLTCQTKHAFWANGKKPLAWSEFEIEDGKVASLVKTGMLAGSLDFSALSRTGVAITFTATTFSGDYEVKRTLYFPVKLNLGSTENLCHGTLIAPDDSRLFYKRSSMPETEFEIPLTGDGTYVASFAPCDIIVFICRFRDENGDPVEYDTTVSAGTFQHIKNLDFR